MLIVFHILKLEPTMKLIKFLSNFFEFDGPCFCQVFTDPDEIFEPKVIAKMDENGKFIPGRLSEAKWN